MAESSLNHLLGNRIMALDRAALPALARRATMRAAGASLDELAQQAGVLDGRAGSALQVRRTGTTAIVPLVGLITSDPFLGWLLGGTSPDALITALQQATADREIHHILLVVDSPGGEVALVEEAAAQIRAMRAIKPITALARTQMCSAAYWIAAQATSVIATPSADVGSVGVFMLHVDESQLNARVGIQPSYIASDPKKVEGNSDAPLTDDARAFLQARVDAMYTTFVTDLALGRKMSVAQVRADFGQGRAFGAMEALKRGLVDRIATLDALLPGSSSNRLSGRQARALTTDEQIAADHEAILCALSADWAPND